MLEPCKRDSRYPGKLHRSLKEILNSIVKISITPVGCHGSHCKNLTAVKARLINACSRENFTVDNITRNTNACGFYWLDEGYFTRRRVFYQSNASIEQTKHDFDQIETRGSVKVRKKVSMHNCSANCL